MSRAPHEDALPVDLEMVYPGEWWHIPVRDEVARNRVVDGMVRSSLRGLDDQPILKRDLRRSLRRNAVRAADNHGTLISLWTQQVGEVILSATVTKYWLVLARPQHGTHLRDVEMSLVDAARADEARDALVPEGQDVAADPASASGSRLDRAEFDAGKVLRRIRRVHGDGGEGLTDDDYESLVVDYWVEMPHGMGLVQVTCSSPMVMFADQLVELFDALVATGSWAYGDPDAASAEPEPAHG